MLSRFIRIFVRLSLLAAGLTIAFVAFALDPLSRDPSYQGSKFQEVWDKVAKTPDVKPYRNLTVDGDVRSLKAFFDDGKRTILSEQDLLSPPLTKKRIRPNGVCLKGVWRVRNSSPYTGLFAKTGAEYPVIARASVGMADTKRGQYRSFGMAVKIFPSTDPMATVKTANFMVIDDNAGNNNIDYVETAMTNEPSLTRNANFKKMAKLMIELKLIQAKVDRHSGYRQLYPLSREGLAPGATAVTPRHIQVKAASNLRVLRDQADLDFRDELNVANFAGHLIFNVTAAATKEGLSAEPIAEMDFTESVVSSACDRELHFTHPKFLR